MFEFIEEKEGKQENEQHSDNKIDSLIRSAVACAAKIATHPELGELNPTDLLCRFSISKTASLQLSSDLKELKKEYDDIEKALFELSPTPENYQYLASASLLAQEKLNDIESQIKAIFDSVKENQAKLEALRTEYTLSITQNTARDVNDIDADISSCVTGMNVQTIKTDALKQSAKIIETEILLIKEAMNQLVERKIQALFPSIKKEFDQALSACLDIYERTAIAAIAANDPEIYRLPVPSEATKHQRKESEIHAKVKDSISKVESALDGEYIFAFKQQILEELSGKDSAN